MATTTAATTSPVVSNTPTQQVSVASSTSAGAAGGSVINVSNIVSQLVAAQQAPQQALIANQTQAVTAQVSALGTLKGALSTFQQSLSALDTPTAFNAQVATSGDQTAFTASASSSAQAGNYTVTVTSLASAQQLVSGPLSASGAIGTGALTVSLGASSFNVSIDSTNNTLAGIAAAINSGANNPGVNATVIQGTDGAHLLLSSSQTGAANSITVAETDGGSGLSAITYGASNTGNYTQVAKALDASFSVAGVPQTSASNTVTTALPGVTLTLLAPTAGGATGAGGTLNVTNDTKTIASNIAAFVAAYNTYQSTVTPLGSFDATTNSAGTLIGNPVLTGTQNQIQNALNSFVGTSSFNSLVSIGITTNSDGSLSLNTNTLQAALATNFSAVSNLFSGTNGVATQLNSQITQSLGSTGTIGSFASTLQTQENNLTTQTNTLNAQAAALTASLTQQYSALNALLSSLQTTSSQLSQTFATLPQVQSTQNA